MMAKTILFDYRVDDSGKGRSALTQRLKESLHIRKIEILSFIALFKLWRLRSSQRKQLAQLPDFMLKDMGISHADVHKEVSKPFWRA